jgi:hypothetical protein
MAFTSRCVYLDESAPLGKSGRSSPLVVSLLPCCQGLYGSAKNTRTASRSTKVPTVESLRALLRRSPSRCRGTVRVATSAGAQQSAACKGSGCVGLFPATEAGATAAWQHITQLTVLGAFQDRDHRSERMALREPEAQGVTFCVTQVQIAYVGMATP